ncbi:hypothetical protein BGY98DRAFT_938363 [Russula aff. rugulosa BPL654]|nr:hypothetical protein BGY98DRAFT_938363 [Russula aff. rugulosa BPL654]
MLEICLDEDVVASNPFKSDLHDATTQARKVDDGNAVVYLPCLDRRPYLGSLLSRCPSIRIGQVCEKTPHGASVSLLSSKLLNARAVHYHGWGWSWTCIRPSQFACGRVTRVLKEVKIELLATRGGYPTNKHFYEHDIVLEPIIIMSISSWGMNESHWTRAFG